MRHPGFSVLWVDNFHFAGQEDLLAFLARTPAVLDHSSILPDDLNPYQVIVVNPFQLDGPEQAKLREHVRAGGGCLGMCTGSTDGEHKLGDLFGARPEAHDPSCEVRLLFTDRDHALAIRLPDAFYVNGPFVSLRPEAGDVEVVLYADWHYAHEPMLSYRSIGRGAAALSAVQDLGQPTFMRILWRLLRQLAGVEQPLQPLGVGLLGYPPSVGPLHAQAVAATPGLDLRWVCDLNPARIEAAQGSIGSPDVHYTKEASLLAQAPNLDLVIVNTPPNSHAQLADAMLKGGKHVVVEKPLALTTAEVALMRQEAEQRGLHLSCHQNRRWDDDYRAIKLAIAQGLIGELFYLETFIGGYGHPCGFWHSEASVSGGTSFDWGAHYLDWILDLMPGLIREVRCTRQNRLWHDVTNADQERIQLRYANGQEAEFLHSDLAFLPKPKWYLLGTKGALVGNWLEQSVYVTDDVLYYRRHDIPPAELGADLRLSRLQARGQIIEQNLPRPPRPAYPFHHNLVDHILLGEPLEVPVDHTARVIAVLESAKRSAEQGGRIEQVEI